MSQNYDNIVNCDADYETGDNLKRRVLCQARGLSQGHNTNTAFFDIPINAPHGFLLVCSNKECATSQRRFRYCVVCATPVSRQNFNKRHGHGLLDSSKGLKKGGDKIVDLPELSYCSESLPMLDGTELASFFHWIENNEDVF